MASGGDNWRRSTMKSEPGAPITLGAAAGVRLIMWRRDCQHRIEPDPRELAGRYGAETARHRVEGAARLLRVRGPQDRYGSDRD